MADRTTAARTTVARIMADRTMADRITVEATAAMGMDTSIITIGGMILEMNRTSLVCSGWKGNKGLFLLLGSSRDELMDSVI